MSHTERHCVYLIPGFFGFADLGQVVYFAHVRDALAAALARLGVEAEIHVVSTEATASIRRRAARLVQTVAETSSGTDSVHLVGHSTGGLDARLAVTPGVVLGANLSAEAVAARVRSVVSVSCPHYGTPLASFFLTIYGKKLLWLLSLVTVYALRYGRLPTSVLLRLAALFVRLDDHLGWRDTLADQAFEQLLGEFSVERRAAVREFLQQAVDDQTLMEQLTFGGIDLFNAAAVDRPSIRYGSVVSCVEPPGISSAIRVGLDPYAQATHGLFAALHRIAGRSRPEQLPRIDGRTIGVLEKPLGRPIFAGDSDGVTPALSQLWGELIGAVQADHLDVIGHFHAPRSDGLPQHYDWFASGSRFDREAFERLWNDVARFVVD